MRERQEARKRTRRVRRDHSGASFGDESYRYSPCETNCTRSVENQQLNTGIDSRL